MLSGDSCQKDRVEVSRIMKVRIENVTKKIKGVTILDNVSCEFEGGKIYGITGANGSGKTMLLRLIAGLIKADSGCVYIDDKILKKDIDHPENIGVLIENPNFWKRYTGMETLKLLADIRKQATEDDIKNALVRAGLEPSDKRVVRKYSLGMRQKLGIAQAIMEKPDILLLDEPTNALDKKSVEQVRKIIHEEAERGAIVIIASHNPQDIEGCSAILEMAEGRVCDE